MDRTWQEVAEEITARLNVEQAYREMGVRVAGSKPSDNGWLSVYAVDRQDSSPSAAINVGTGKLRGRYVDKAGQGVSLGLFEFAARFCKHKFADWREARKEFAIRTGVKLPRGGDHSSSSPSDSLAFCHWSVTMVRRWVDKKPGTSVEAVRQLGGQVARWPAKAPPDAAHQVIAFPVFNSFNQGDEPSGWVMVNITGGALRLYQGPGKDPISGKAFVTRGTKPSLLSRFALDHIAGASVVWIVEGATDTVSLQAHIPADMTDSHVVVSNVFGATEWPDKSWAPLFQGKHCILVRDCDEPGQLGAERWVEFLFPLAATVKNVVLPYPVIKQRGKDVRDFFAEGNTFKALLALAERTAPVTREKAQAVAESKVVANSDEDFLLNSLKVDVLGEYPDGQIEAFSIHHKKLFTIRTIGRFSYAELVQHVGEPAIEYVTEARATDAPGRVSHNQVKVMIARAAGGCRLTSRTTLGAGCWRVDGTNDVVLVDSGGGAKWDGRSLSRIDRPRIGTQVFDFAAMETWCDLDSLSKFLEDMTHEVAKEILEDARKLFGKWKWATASCPEVLAALSACTWTQTLWTWRPLVAITGSSAAGKSTLFDTLLQGLFGRLGFYAQKPTEAGLRQHIKNSAYAIFVDELEDGPHRQRIMELLRTSTRGGRILRGSPSQHGISYGMKHIVWIAAIESGLKREPDRNRFITMELERQEPSKREKLVLPTSQELNGLGTRLLAVALKYTDSAILLAERLKGHHIEGCDNRIVETYAVPAALVAAA